MSLGVAKAELKTLKIYAQLKIEHLGMKFVDEWDKIEEIPPWIRSLYFSPDASEIQSV